MQVRSLSIKTTEILQLDLAIREEMENAIDELDALLFAVNFDPITATQHKAISLRVNTLSQISQLLPERDFLGKSTSTLTIKLENLLRHPDEARLQEMLDHLNALRELLKNPPKADTSPALSKHPDSSRHPHTRAPNQFVPYAAKRKFSQSPFNPEAETLQKIRVSLDTEFQLTIDALRNLFRPAFPVKEGRVQHLLSHATQIFKDLAQTTKGQIPKARLHLEQIPCLILSIKGQSFALPQKSVLRVINPEEYRSIVKTWECPGGRIIKVNGQAAGEISLANVLGFSPEASNENLPQVLVGTSRGAMLLAAETSGELIPLVLDHSAQLLSRMGPYLGAAIHPAAEASDDDRTIMILNPEELAKIALVSPASSAPIPPPVAQPNENKEQGLFNNVLVASTAQNKLISIPMGQISHVELIPATAMIFHEGLSYVSIGQKAVLAIDPDEVISTKSRLLARDIHDFQAVIMRRGNDLLAVLTREILGSKQESNLTDFGFDQKPGIRGAALCDDLVVCALDPWVLVRNFSHFSKPTPNHVKIDGNLPFLEARTPNFRTAR